MQYAEYNIKIFGKLSYVCVRSVDSHKVLNRITAV